MSGCIGRDGTGPVPRVVPGRRRSPAAVVRLAAWVLALLAFPAVARSENSPCSVEGMRITSVEKARGATDDDRYVLNDRVRVHFEDGDALHRGQACASRIMLLLDDRPIEGVEPLAISRKGVVEFPLAITPKSRPVWDEVFADALNGGWRREVSINLGLVGVGPLSQDERFSIVMNLFPTTWTVVFAIVLVVLAGCFVTLAAKSNLLRDTPPPPDTVAVLGGRLAPSRAPPDVGPYSLARVQGAWWLAVILASYCFIGVVTGDFAGSLNGTAVILLGIGFGTVMGGGIISQQKRDEQLSRARALAGRVRDMTEWEELDRSKSTLSGPGAERHAALSDKYPDLVGGRDFDELIGRLSRDYAVATNQGSQGFLTDILTDADGVSFARFQLFAWTLVLGVVFVSTVLGSLSMPVFDTTLMGLMGLSSATYLGLKIPEPTVPKQP